MFQSHSRPMLYSPAKQVRKGLPERYRIGEINSALGAFHVANTAEPAHLLVCNSRHVRCFIPIEDIHGTEVVTSLATNAVMIVNINRWHALRSFYYSYCALSFGISLISRISFLPSILWKMTLPSHDESLSGKSRLMKLPRVSFRSRLARKWTSAISSRPRASKHPIK